MIFSYSGWLGSDVRLENEWLWRKLCFTKAWCSCYWHLRLPQSLLPAAKTSKAAVALGLLQHAVFKRCKTGESETAYLVCGKHVCQPLWIATIGINQSLFLWGEKVLSPRTGKDQPWSAKTTPTGIVIVVILSTLTWYNQALILNLCSVLLKLVHGWIIFSTLLVTTCLIRWAYICPAA